MFVSKLFETAELANWRKHI